MTVRLTEWRGALPRAILLASVVALVPLPVAASDTAPAPKGRTTLQASVQAIAAREVANAPLKRVPARRAEQAGTPTNRSGGFFKTAPGMAALAVMIVGGGYAIYTTHHDRVKSPAKQ